jgi:hypothetical protein
MEAKNKLYFAIAFFLFYFVDILTTCLGLQNGGYEANPVMSSVGFFGMISVKTLFMVMLLGFMAYLEKYKKYAQELGVMIGSVIAFGIFTLLINIGFYR